MAIIDVDGTSRDRGRATGGGQVACSSGVWQSYTAGGPVLIPRSRVRGGAGLGPRSYQQDTTPQVPRSTLLRDGK